MKPLMPALAAVLLFAAGSAFAGTKTVTLQVEGMYCVSCPTIVKQSLSKVDGVSKVDVSFEKKTAIVTYEDTRASIAKLVAATTNQGFPSTPAN